MHRFNFCASLALGLASAFSASCPQAHAQSSREVKPYADIAEELAAQKRSIDKNAAELMATRKRLDAQIKDLGAKINDFTTRRKANERFGEHWSSGETWRRNHALYVATRDHLEQERLKLKAELDQLVRRDTVWDSDRKSILERYRQYNGRVANGGVNVGGDLYFDENAPRKR